MKSVITKKYIKIWKKLFNIRYVLNVIQSFKLLIRIYYFMLISLQSLDDRSIISHLQLFVLIAGNKGDSVFVMKENYIRENVMQHESLLSLCMLPIRII